MANYQALYRKYRPQSFDDVVGQMAITQTLKTQLMGDHLSHAYLFTGSRGTGKTTCAKILAKAVIKFSVGALRLEAFSTMSMIFATVDSAQGLVT